MGAQAGLFQEQVLKEHAKYGFDTPEAYAFWLEQRGNRDIVIALCNKVVELEKKLAVVAPYDARIMAMVDRIVKLETRLAEMEETVEKHDQLAQWGTTEGH